LISYYYKQLSDSTQPNPAALLPLWSFPSVFIGDARIMAHEIQHQGYQYLLFNFSGLLVRHQCNRHALRVIGWLEAGY